MSIHRPAPIDKRRCMINILLELLTFYLSTGGDKYAETFHFGWDHRASLGGGLGGGRLHGSAGFLLRGVADLFGSRGKGEPFGGQHQHDQGAPETTRWDSPGESPGKFKDAA